MTILNTVDAAPALEHFLPGGAGWAGAGLLGMVLTWLLLKHLPAKDEQICSIMDKYNERLDRQRGEFSAALKDMGRAYKEESAAERAACERHFTALGESVNAAFRTIGEQLQSHSQRNQQWLELLKAEVERQYGTAYRQEHK